MVNREYFQKMMNNENKSEMSMDKVKRMNHGIQWIKKEEALTAVKGKKGERWPDKLTAT